MDIVDYIVQQLQVHVERLKAKDKNFAREYEARKGELRDFADLFYKQCKSGGTKAVFGLDDELEGALIHFFHEPKGSVKEFDLRINAFKPESDKPEKKPTPSAASKPASSKPAKAAPKPKPAAPTAAPPSAPVASAPAPPVPSAHPVAAEEEEDWCGDLFG